MADEDEAFENAENENEVANDINENEVVESMSESDSLPSPRYVSLSSVMNPTPTQIVDEPDSAGITTTKADDDEVINFYYGKLKQGTRI